METITKCAVCGNEHEVILTKDKLSKVVATFCPINKQVHNVTTGVYNGIDIIEPLKAFITIQFSTNGLKNLHDNSMQRLSKKVAYEFLITQFGKQHAPNFYFTQYHAYKLLQEYKNAS